MPGHTPGHVVFFRESDRIAIVGDVLVNIHFVTGGPGFGTPVFSADADENRSIRKLAELRPSTICFGHGPLREAFPCWSNSLSYAPIRPASAPVRLRPVAGTLRHPVNSTRLAASLRRVLTGGSGCMQIIVYSFFIFRMPHLDSTNSSIFSHSLNLSRHFETDLLREHGAQLVAVTHMFK